MHLRVCNWQFSRYGRRRVSLEGRPVGCLLDKHYGTVFNQLTVLHVISCVSTNVGTVKTVGWGAGKRRHDGVMVFTIWQGGNTTRPACAMVRH